MKKALIFWFSFLFILLWMTSCSVRKVDKNTVKKESEVNASISEKRDLIVKDTSNLKVKAQTIYSDETIVEKRTFTPIDPTKPSSFIDDHGQKQDLKNTSMTEESTRSKTNKTSQINSNASNGKTLEDKGKKNIVIDAKAKADNLSKNTQRTSFNWFWLLLLLIPVGVYVLWKNKDKIWSI